MPLCPALARCAPALLRLMAIISLFITGPVIGLNTASARDVEYAFGASLATRFAPASVNQQPSATPSRFTGTEAIQLAQWETSDATLVNCQCEACGDRGQQLAPSCRALSAGDSCTSSWLDTLTLFGGIDGSKQPQDYGTNANLGGRASFNWGIPLSYEYGIGLQVGSAIVGSGNAVRVHELQGEETDRFQSYTTLGFFQRARNGISWGIVYDFLYEDSYDQFALSQWRGRVAYNLNSWNQVGMTLQLSGQRDTGFFNATQVTLDPITQGSFFWRTLFESGAQTTFWAGMAEGHGESNSAVGYAPPTDEVFVFGADILAPLNDRMALYGETNLMMPADTGTVDAYLGLEFFPWGGAYRNRRRQFSPLLPTAASTSFSVDLSE